MSAYDDLSDNMKALISFALQRDDIKMIEHAAPDKYIERYYARRYSRLSSEIVNNQAAFMAYPDVDFDAFAQCNDHPIFSGLSEIDQRFCLYKHREHGQTKIVYHSDIDGHPAAYPVNLRSGTAQLDPSHLSSLSRRFAVPIEQLQQLFHEPH